MIKTLYVNQLETAVQFDISLDILKALSPDLNADDLREAFDNALNSRLCDLSDLIDINKYL